MPATLESRGDIALITMDDGKANAVSYAMLDALNGALDDAKDAKAIVLAGRERMFSGGFDLSVMNTGDINKMTDLVSKGGVLAHRLYGLDKPLIAAATGHGIAMGLFTLLACDTRIGPDAPAKYGMTETAIGMVIPMFAQVLTEERVPKRFLTNAFIQANVFDSHRAVEAGFLDRLVAPEKVVDTALEVAEMMGAYPNHAYVGNKLQLRKPALDRMAESLGL